MERKYKWDGTDSHRMFNFQLALYSREESVLRKFDFENDIPLEDFDEEEQNILMDLESKGMIFSYIVDGEKYYHGTALYLQYR
jgi:hypothetical protein